MSKDQNSTEESQSPEAKRLIDRRRLLRGFSTLLGAGALGAGLLPRDALGQQEASGLSNRDFTQEELQGEPYVTDEVAPFDMNTAHGNRMGTLKITNNLIGEKTYVAMFSRVLLGPQGKPGAPIHGHIGLWTWQLQVPSKEEFPEAPEGSIVQRAMFTGMILDPFSFKPVNSVYNHYVKKEVEAQDSTFAESYLFNPVKGVSSVDRPEFMDDPNAKVKLNAHLRWGDEFAVYLAGIFQNEGPNQPRMDSSVWTTRYADFINPKKHLIRTDYNFAGLMRAWERPWIGVGKDDDAQLLWNVKGRKIHSLDEMPELVRDNIVKKYPDRI